MTHVLLPSTHRRGAQPVVGVHDWANKERDATHCPVVVSHVYVVHVVLALHWTGTLRQ